MSAFDEFIASWTRKNQLMIDTAKAELALALAAEFVDAGNCQNNHFL